MNKKHTLLLAFLAFFAVSGFSQLTSPRVSPHQKIEQTIGLTTISVDYHRPAKNNREIFGGLVPYNKVWRTGANENTIINFDNDVLINGQALEKGSYALYTKPSLNKWIVYFYDDTNNWGNPSQWDKNKVALETSVPINRLTQSVENFTINFSNLKTSRVDLDLIWDQVAVSIPIDVQLNSVVENNTKKQLAQNVNDYATAARNYLNQEINLQDAQKYIENAIYLRVKPSYRDYRTYAQILAKNKLFEQAINAAEKSSYLAKQEKQNYYTTSTIAANDKDVNEWKTK